jgi:hypothetical protein
VLPWPGSPLHPPAACGTEQQAAQRVRHRRFSAADETRTAPRPRPKTNGLRQFIGDQRFVSAAIRRWSSTSRVSSSQVFSDETGTRGEFSGRMVECSLRV